MGDAANISSNSTHGTADNVAYPVVASLAAFLCLFGLVGNAVVIWILAFKIKRNKYTVYILNLAVADFVYLLFVAVVMILMVNRSVNKQTPSGSALLALEVIYDFGYNAGMLFLTAISVERCLSVLFPIWYKCYRPKHLSTYACVFLWMLGALLSLLDNFICPVKSFMGMAKDCTGFQVFTIILTFVLIIPLMLFSSFILIYIVKSTSKKSRPPKIYVAIIVTVMVFLFSVAPIRLLWTLYYFQVLPGSMFTLAFYFSTTYFTVLNSSANPFIYFFVGRHRKKRFGGSVNEALSRVFKDDDHSSDVHTITTSMNSVSSHN
ncbi:proto-oncogene Mas [Gastrophryne carolinensis]